MTLASPVNEERTLFLSELSINACCLSVNVALGMRIGILTNACRVAKTLLPIFMI